MADKKDLTVIIFCDTDKNWLGLPALNLENIGTGSSLEMLLSQLQPFGFPVFVLFDNAEAADKINSLVSPYGAQAVLSPSTLSEAVRIKSVMPFGEQKIFLRLRAENPILGKELLEEFLNDISDLTVKENEAFFVYTFGYPTGINLEFFNTSLLESALFFKNNERLREVAETIRLRLSENNILSLKTGCPEEAKAFSGKTFRIKKLLPTVPEMAHPEIRWTLGTKEDLSCLRGFLQAYSPELSIRELLLAWNNRHLALASAPKLLNVEPSNYCNLKCIMCPRDKMTRPQGRMSMELFETILAQAVEMGVEQIVLNGYGEPFLHPDIFNMLELLRKSGLQSRMYTNAQLLQAEYINRLSAFPPHHLTISLDGFNPKTYEKIRRNGNFQKVMDNLEYLLESRKSWSQSMKIDLRITQMPETKSDIDDYMNFWQERVDEINLVPMHNWGGQVNGGVRVMPEESVRFPCKELWRTMMIFWDGRVSVCCAAFDDNLIVGDLKKESLSAIWSGRGYAHLRELHASNRADEIALCRDCDVWQSYG